MKATLLLGLTLFVGQLQAQTTKFFTLQQCNAFQSSEEYKATKDTNVLKFSINGKGSFNQATIDEINGSGKIDVDFLISTKHKENTNKYNLFWANIGLNKNATNGDSNIISSIVFPDLGKNSIASSLNYSRVYTNSNFATMLGASIDFNLKTFKKYDSARSNATQFDNLNFTLNAPIHIMYTSKLFPIALGVIPNISWHNIVNEDAPNLQKIVGDSVYGKGFHSLGVKLEVTLNNAFCIYGDMRSMYFKESATTNSDFVYNVGIAFRAPILSNKEMETAK